MIIGSGLIAKGFVDYFATRHNVCIYAAGVSNSSCTDAKAFERERVRLLAALEDMSDTDAFLYFSTCSILDLDARNTAYVQHKIAMEKLVKNHNKYLIFRLPQVAGRTPNPHTLLNYIHARILQGEVFNVWRNAKRNIIDITDVVAVVRVAIDDPLCRCKTFCAANLNNYSIIEIVKAMERVVNKKAIIKVSERGSEYMIDTRNVLPLYEQAKISFDKQYLDRTLNKYYGGE